MDVYKYCCFSFFSDPLDPPSGGDILKKPVVGRAGSIEPSSHSRESGFQSATSLTSLEHGGLMAQHQQQQGQNDKNHSPVSTLTGKDKN